MPARRKAAMRLGTMCIALAILAGSPVLAHAGRYELVPEPDVRQSSTNRVASAYVIDKKANQFWICTARYKCPASERYRQALADRDRRCARGNGLRCYQCFSPRFLVH